jgi:transposase
MRGDDIKTEAMFYYLSPESMVPQEHPIRPIRKMVDQALQELSPEFDKMYSRIGRPSIPPEKLLKGLLLQTLFSIRSVRQLMDQVRYNILFKWFLGLAMDDKVWDHSTFSQNQDRLIDTDIALKFMERIQAQAEKAGLISKEHFSVDGTLIEAWASIKSFRPKTEKTPPPKDTRNDEMDFRGTKLKNDTHESKTDPDCRIYKKSSGGAAKLCYMGHLLMENRNGLIVASSVTHATGTAERETAEEMVAQVAGDRHITVGGDKNYDTNDFVLSLRSMSVTPHVAANTERKGGSAIDGRTTRHSEYGVSLKFRKRIEEAFGWMKTVGNIRKIKYRGIPKVSWHFIFTAAAYNLVRMRNLGVAVT